ALAELYEHQIRCRLVAGSKRPRRALAPVPRSRARTSVRAYSQTGRRDTMTESPFLRKPERPEPIQSKVSPTSVSMKCPDCACPDVRKVSMIVETGTKSTSSVAVGMTGDGDIGGSMIRGSQQSLLSSRL